jgi:hypothetical protein
MRFFIMGGTGFVGRHLIRILLSKNHEVMVLVRSESGLEPAARLTCILGNPLEDGDWQAQARKCDVIVNLVGAGIFTRWTAGARERIVSTRAASTRAAVTALGTEWPGVFLCANATGFYGPGGETVLTEDSPAGKGFLADVCRAWQKEAEKATRFGHRVCILRFGAVLGPGGGALQTMLPVFRLGLGGPVSGGRQWFSWIHIQDLADAALFLARTESAQGVYNFCAPEPVRNRELAKSLGRGLHRPAVLPVPGWALRLRFGRAAQVVLNSQRCVPRRLEAQGFEFAFPELDMALIDILQRTGSSGR